MKNRMVRGRALRAAVGGLLTSSLTDVELKRFAEELDFEFLADLRDMLMSLPLRSGPYQAELYHPEAATDTASLIYEKAKSKRISKDRVIVYMREIDQPAAKSASSSESTLRGLIESFVARVGPDAADRLMNRMFGRPEQDPYLAGISEAR